MKNHKLLLWSLTVALSGLLFGLDSAVISGAEQTIQKLWHLGDFTHGFVVSKRCTARYLARRWWFGGGRAGA